MDPMRLYLAQLCVAERAWGVLRIVQALGESVTNNCVLWSPRAMRCGLEPQPAAAALASAFMMHPMIPSPQACVIRLSWTKPEPSTTWAAGSDSTLDHRCTPAECWLRPYSVSQSSQEGSCLASSIFRLCRNRLWDLMGFSWHRACYLGASREE